MDALNVSLEDYFDNFDPNSFLSEYESEINVKTGMKPQSGENGMQACTLSGDNTIFHESENTPDGSVYQSGVPLTNEVAGEYNFQIKIGTQAKRVANPDWVYKNDKLYVKPSIVCPILFDVLPSASPSCHIRVTPVFKDQAHIRDIIRCCPNHSVIEANTNDYGSVAHFIRCENRNVVYDECPITGRFYLTIPFVPCEQDPTTKSVTTHELFSFVCNNSCGGLNRRAIQIIFELMQGDTVVGRRLVEVRVCACPGRDSTLDETQKQPLRRRRRHQSLEQPKHHYVATARPPYQVPVSVDAATTQESAPVRKKRTGENYYLKINGRQNFVIMERIAKALELFTSMERRFFSNTFPFQTLGQMSKNFHDESSKYVEPDSTLFRSNSRQSVPTSAHSPLATSPTASSHWPDSTYPHGNHATSPPSIPDPYSECPTTGFIQNNYDGTPK